MTKRVLLLPALLLLLGSTPVAAQSSVKSRKAAAPPAKTYYLVLLKNAVKQQQDVETVATIRAGHAAHLQQLTKEGRLRLAGRCPGANSALGGMYILSADSYEQARQLTAADPAVQAGSLTMEIYPWEKQTVARQP
ncbi:YciI family protein [Hymenobacter lucidus]|uniref:YciI family protein n=1 Tax=Hymenobacter lucidus TaxID=2880930 RepID=A0ABS8AN67_9BACT|nr:YciI family protein [Hymenobacter lucidus]MCB2407633.1 YciI family protein [Hymenobacter lucidus]